MIEELETICRIIEKRPAIYVIYKASVFKKIICPACHGNHTITFKQAIYTCTKCMTCYNGKIDVRTEVWKIANNGDALARTRFTFDWHRDIYNKPCLRDEKGIGRIPKEDCFSTVKEAKLECDKRNKQLEEEKQKRIDEEIEQEETDNGK